MTRAALCFPGQGSQCAGMADGLLDEPLARSLLAVADAEGLDLAAALRGSDEELRPTEIAQPGLLFVELVLASVLPTDLDIVGVAGHSVGEYAAVSVAGAYSAEDAMRLVIRRGREMAAMHEGTMVAVIGLDVDSVTVVCEEVRAGGDVVVVGNVNAPAQVVVSGSVDGVRRAGELARQAGARKVIPLNVSGAFHSPLMAPAAQRFAEVINATPRGVLRCPVVCNVDGAAVAGSDALPERLARQLESPVLWIDCVRTLVALGAEVLVELGPGAVLSGLARRIDPTAATATVNDRDGAARLATSPATPA
ncbi:MAG: ACP S-malonyltransferase [Candidatus Dormibacteraeota bacterium]|uniref:Malonyl CoA-acyl carrier protein transacylase n=1 Tax=Candidatus Aeolococcus gillhamiae TaxID=3127015 RepID=A0A934K0L4_9BACT|nr:ACP S-malonyltransferase [Candidatus Dormibacteraeota bacterium]